MHHRVVVSPPLLLVRVDVQVQVWQLQGVRRDCWRVGERPKTFNALDVGCLVPIRSHA